MNSKALRFTCPICQEYFNDFLLCPKLLTACGHTICSRCISMIKNENQNEEDNNTVNSEIPYINTDFTLKCPLCKTKTKGNAIIINKPLEMISKKGFVYKKLKNSLYSSYLGKRINLLCSEHQSVTKYISKSFPYTSCDKCPLYEDDIKILSVVANDHKSTLKAFIDTAQKEVFKSFDEVEALKEKGLQSINSKIDKIQKMLDDTIDNKESKFLKRSVLDFAIETYKQFINNQKREFYQLFSLNNQLKGIIKIKKQELARLSYLCANNFQILSEQEPSLIMFDLQVAINLRQRLEKAKKKCFFLLDENQQITVIKELYWQIIIYTNKLVGSNSFSDDLERLKDKLKKELDLTVKPSTLFPKKDSSLFSSTFMKKENINKNSAIILDKEE